MRYIKPRLTHKEQSEIEALRAENSELKEIVESLTYKVRKIDEGVQEVVKKDDSELPIGDYLNPLVFVDGDEVEQGLFYTDGNDVWECIKHGFPMSFNDPEFFDII